MTELKKMLMFLVVGGLDPNVPMPVQSHRKQTDLIIKHVKDMISEAENDSWDDGYQQCTYDTAKGQNI